MDSDSRTLRTVFAAAEANRLALESGYDAQAPAHREALAAALRDYRACQELIRRAALFSVNETADDLATADMPYLLVDAHLAELGQKQATPSAAARRETLVAARDAYERFLHRLDAYGLLSAPHRRLLARYADAPAEFTTVPPPSAGASSDIAARREAKIANFRAEKELRARLALLRRQQGTGPDDNEEAVRVLRMTELEFAAHMAFQGLEGLNREWEMLAQAPAPEEEERRRRLGGDGRTGADGYSDRVDAPLRQRQQGGPLLSRQGKPLQPFTLLGNRQELARGVFKPGHNLPTMTIDEYLEEERRRGGIIEGGGEASGRREEPDEDNVEKADAETMKAREWDEFKEANPRGSGNTLNRG